MLGQIYPANMFFFPGSFLAFDHQSPEVEITEDSPFDEKE